MQLGGFFIDYLDSKNIIWSKLTAEKWVNGVFAESLIGKATQLTDGFSCLIIQFPAFSYYPVYFFEKTTILINQVPQKWGPNYCGLHWGTG